MSRNSMEINAINAVFVEESVVDETKRLLTGVLHAYLHCLTFPLSPGQVGNLCRRVGIWPIPSTPALQLKSLQIFSARALPYFNQASSTSADKRFLEWCECLQHSNSDGAHQLALQLGFWSYGDSRSLGVY